MVNLVGGEGLFAQDGEELIDLGMDEEAASKEVKSDDVTVAAVPASQVATADGNSEVVQFLREVCESQDGGDTELHAIRDNMPPSGVAIEELEVWLAEKTKQGDNNGNPEEN